MKICRFNDDRLGVVRDASIFDVSHLLDLLPAARWPVPHGDLLIANLPGIVAALRTYDFSGPSFPVNEVRLLSPVANPSKIIGAPANFMPNDGSPPTVTARELGMFLKASSSICGAGDGVITSWPDRIIEHEIELAVIIGRKGFAIAAEDALDHVAGYTIGLDMTAQGPEDRSFRKSFDSFSVLGPWIVTADELADPGELHMELSLDGVRKQSASTASLVLNVQQLIQLSSSVYTLHPGDVIMTGSPDGVSPVSKGSLLTASISQIGMIEVSA